MKLDVGAPKIRFQQLQENTKQIEKHCETLIGNVQQMCKNILQIIQKDNAKLTFVNAF